VLEDSVCYVNGIEMMPVWFLAGLEIQNDQLCRLLSYQEFLAIALKEKFVMLF